MQKYHEEQSARSKGARLSPLECWSLEGSCPFAIQRITVCKRQGPWTQDFDTVLALTCKEGSTVPAL